MKITDQNVDKFLAEMPENRQSALKKLDKMITSQSPKGTSRVICSGKFWGGTDQNIVGYGDMTFINSKKEEVSWFTVGLANQKNYITVYVNGYEDGMGLAKKYGDKLGKVKTSTSAVNIKNLEDVDLDELKKLIKKAFDLNK